MMRCIFSKPHAIIACFASALLLAGCSQSEYYGINLKPVAEIQPTKIQSLASRAKSGDKEAQLELGILFETGRNGLNKDLEKAKALYEEAARDINLTQTNFIPNRDSVQAVRVSTGKVLHGLDEARRRLNWLDSPMENIDAFIKLASSYYVPEAGKLVFRPDARIFDAFDKINPYKFLKFCEQKSEDLNEAIVALCGLNPDGLKFYLDMDVLYELCVPEGLYKGMGGKIGVTTGCFLERSASVDSSRLDFMSSRSAWRIWAYASTVEKCEHFSSGGYLISDNVGEWFEGTPNSPLPNRPLSMFTALMQDSFNYEKWAARTRGAEEYLDDRNNYSDHWIKNYCLDRVGRYRPKPLLSNGERILCNTFNFYFLRKVKLNID